MTTRPPTCWGADRCGWSDAYRECPCIDDPDDPAPLDEYERAFLLLHGLDADAEPPEPFYVPGFCFHLGAQGGAWPATRRPEYRDWPDHITDLRLPEETP